MSAEQGAAPRERRERLVTPSESRRRADEGLLAVHVPKPSVGWMEGKAAFWRWLWSGYRPEPSPAHRGLVESFEDDKVGVCCSGGGIRSASFNLGALQALQKAGVLETAKYLAAVSGGSYIAAGFCMVAKTWPEGTPPKQEGDRGFEDSDPGVVTAEEPPFHPGSPEEQYLRNRSTYMAPTGLDKLYLVWRLLLGLVINLTLVGLPLFALGTILAVAIYHPFYDPLHGGAEPFQAEGLWVWALLGVIAVLAALVGLGSLLFRITDDNWRRGLEAWSSRLLLLLAGTALLLVLVPELVALVRPSSGTDPTTTLPPTIAGPAVGGGGLVGLLIAAVMELRARPTNSAGATEVKGIGSLWRKAGPKLRRAFAALAAGLAGPAVLVAFVVLGASLTLAHKTTWMLVGGILGPLAVFAVFYFLSDLSTWSLHPFYRRRLCTAFALKRVAGEESEQPRAVERDYDALVPLSESGVWPGPSGRRWPLLLVCAAVNISDSGATASGRGVASFTFSPAAIGGPLTGAAETTEYEKRLGRNRLRDITLPATVAVSGAAISPSMGKLTWAPTRVLMALANVRLGVWVPNPRHLRNGDWKQKGPLGSEERFDPAQRVSGIERLGGRPRDLRKDRRPRDLRKRPRLSYLFRELLGRNRADAQFLYVTDGGHYENLGLVELLRRGCSRIYCLDASGGRPAAALGDAIALARSELSVDVKIDPSALVPDDDGFTARSCAVGDITYRGNKVGRLVYAPTVVTAKVPWDVLAYRAKDPVFPHHSTAAQLYSDERFEAYRALGEHIGEKAHAAMISGIPEDESASAA